MMAIAMASYAYEEKLFIFRRPDGFRTPADAVDETAIADSNS
jgi:hypothetical protein